MKKYLTVFLFVVLLFPLSLFGAGNAVINEVAWMGTKVSSNNEWMELANTSQTDVDITGWTLQSADKSINITLKGSISAGGFFLLERTNDTTLPGISADQIYVGALGNAGETLVLKDANSSEVDRVDAASGWPAGDNTTKNTMQRSVGGWITATPTPKQANAQTPAPSPTPPPPPPSPVPTPQPSPPPPPPAPSPQPSPSPAPVPPPSPSPSPQPQPSPVPEPAPLAGPAPVPTPTPATIQLQEQVNPEPAKQLTVNYPHSIYISEFLPNPKGADETAEWIELYNDADASANISGFLLDDGQGASHPYQIPAGTIMPAKAFLVFNRAQTKLALNNTSDEVRLLYPDKSVAASVKYEGAKEGVAGAYDLRANKLFWTTKATPGQANIISVHALVSSAKNTHSSYQASELLAGKANNVSSGAAGDLNIADASGDNAQDSANQLASPLPATSHSSLPDFLIIALAVTAGAAGLFAYLKFFKKVKFLLVIALLMLPFLVSAETFNVASDLEAQGKTQVEADAITSTPHSIAYLQQGVAASQPAIYDLINEFENVIYPRLTAFLGLPSLGINNDTRITILFMKMAPGIGGYYDPENELSRSEYAPSNERKIVFLSTDYLSRYKIKEFLAHEFTHSITYNQKFRRLNKVEEVWLNELRSEYAPSFLGYDENFSGSNLEERYRDYLRNPYDHLITWNNTSYDYAQVNMLAQYLNARFGSEFFSREIKSDDVGVASVNKTVQTLDPNLSFAKFIAQWRLTNYINDSSVADGKYSYKNNNLPFSFAPELSMDIAKDRTAPQVLTASVPTFSSKAIVFHTTNSGSLLTFSTPDVSSDLVVSYVKEQKDGSTSDSLLTLENGSGQIASDKNTVAILAVISNASQKVINTTFTITGQPVIVRQPVISSVEPVFVHPSLENNAVIIKGQDFDPKAAVYFNGKLQAASFQDERTLIVKVLLPDKIITVKVLNPDGTQATYLWNNLIQEQVQPSLVTASISSTPNIPDIPNGSLIKTVGDYKVYVINNGFKRHIVSATIFSFYPTLNPAAITVLSPGAINTYPESVLIRAAGDQKVYEILPNGTKRWIQTAQDFIARGFNWNAVFEVNNRELNFYQTAS